MSLPKIVVGQEDDSTTIRIDPHRLLVVGEAGAALNWQQDDSADIHLAVRLTGPLAARAFYLDVGYDWALGVDELGNAVLVPLKPVSKQRTLYFHQACDPYGRIHFPPLVGENIK